MSGKPGQGRKFHLEDALEAAMIVFWAHGYEGASMAELTRAMGIKAPSLYKAYGSKEDLFFSVVDHYNSTHGSFMSSAMAEEKDGLAMLRRILLEAAEHYPSKQYPGGCLVISAAVSVTSAHEHVAQRLASMRNDNIRLMSSRDDVSKDMARFTAATLQGMSQQARDGATSDELKRIAQLAISALEHEAQLLTTAP